MRSHAWGRRMNCYQKEKESRRMGDIIKAEEWPLLEREDAEILDIARQNFQGQQISAFHLERISVPTGGATKWTVETADGAELHDSVSGVILHAYDTRAYWIGSEEEGAGGLSNAPPDCSSIDCTSAEGRISSDAESGTRRCGDCPMSTWGSGRGGSGQACKVKKRIFILAPDSVHPIPIGLFLPPTSLKAFTQYVLRLSRFGLPMWGVVTEFSLTADKDSNGNPFARAVPKNIGRVPDRVRELCWNLRQELMGVFLASHDAEWNGGDKVDTP